MKNKPIIFTILSILCFIEPLIKILYFKAATHFDFFVIVSNLMTKTSFRDVFDFWIVFPLAGILLIKLRRWTYFSFMALLAYVIYNIMTYEEYTWPYNSDAPFMYHYVVVGVGTVVFFLFLMPGMREPFFDRRVRWWEPKTRYPVNIVCSLKNDSLVFNSEILNISLSGAFLKESDFLKEGERLNMEFNFLGKRITLPIEVVHHLNLKDKKGYGVKFVFHSFRQSLQLSKIINIIKRTHHSL